jgi:3-phosphoshikimate 1-carboxyvinyltransferase
MINRIVKPAARLMGTAWVPGDKSISHRALILSAIAVGESEITGLSDAADVRSTQRCLEGLGVSIDTVENKVVVHGKGRSGLSVPTKLLDAGNSGTTIRMLAGILAAQDFVSTIDGDASLRNRPMRRIIEPLGKMGARIESASQKPPLTIHGTALHAINYASPIASAQIKSCVLLAGLYAKGTSRVTEPAPSRDHTERMLNEFGVPVKYWPGGAELVGPANLHCCNIDVPGDISAAAYLLVAASLLPESGIEIQNVGINPLRRGIVDVLASMGASVLQRDAREVNNEPRATLIPTHGRLNGVSLGGAIIPQIIDEIPILAIAATQAKGTTTIRDASELRVKESDRITAVCENLRRMGAKASETKDGMIITGPTRLRGAEIESFGDHRIAMSFAVAGLIAEGETSIMDAECVTISFPNFFDLLESIRRD